MFAASLSVGALLPFEETARSIETPAPDESRRAIRSIGTSPWVSGSVRYGRGLALYAAGGLAFAGDAELSGTDPFTNAPLEGSEGVGAIWTVSAGASFTPLRNAEGLRIEVGPAWLDLGTGGSYVAVRIAAAAKFLQIDDVGGVLVAWDGYFAGGQHDRDEVEYQIREGLISGVRLGFEITR